MKSFLLPWFQIPLFVCMSFSLRGMVISPELVDSLSAGGFGWVTDLTARDPTMIFPIAIGMSNFLNVEVRADFSHQGADFYFYLQTIPVIDTVMLSPSSIPCICETNSHCARRRFRTCLEAFHLRSSQLRRKLQW